MRGSNLRIKRERGRRSEKIRAAVSETDIVTNARAREKGKENRGKERESETREHRRRTKMNGVNNMWHISKISAHCSQFLHPRQIGERSRFACLLKVATGGNLTSADADRSRALPRGHRNKKTVSRDGVFPNTSVALPSTRSSKLSARREDNFSAYRNVSLSTETDFTSKVL